MKTLRTVSPTRVFIFLFFLHLAVSMALFLLLLPAILPVDSATLLDNTADYDSEIVAARLEEYGETGRRAYAIYLIFLDTPYALLTGAVLAAALRLISTLSSRLKLGRWVYAFPILLVALDVTENGLLFSFSRSFPALNASLANAASIVTSLKLALVNATFLLFLLAWGLLIWYWLKAETTAKVSAEK